MSEVWISFNACDRRRYWWRNVIGTLVLVGVVAAMALTTHEPGTWWWVGGLGAFVVGMFVSTVNLIYGRSLLTERGLEFRTFVSRRAIPWSEVAAIETRQRVSRSGIWSDLRVVRVRGRSLGMPGTVTNRMTDIELDQKQTTIREYWFRAISR
ncbi:hypothetical protein [Streptomyces sp. NPDC052225]|uniref:hypothetical protein n=1 Tax=Streptomyces sp. NPDC052225 TaxID=3154949 RepID=UPI00341E48FB